MKVAVVFVLAALACVSGDAPPIPYAAGAGESGSFANDRVQAVGSQYVDHFGADGFNIQSGYEGFLVPGAEHGFFPLVEGIDLKGHGLVPKILKNLLALGWRVIPKIAIGAVILLGLFLVGGCVNALICTFTPLCTISFHGVTVTKDTMRSYLTPDRITSTTNFVMDAIRKYKDLYERMSNEIETGKGSTKK